VIGVTCAAVLQLRRKGAGGDGWVAPGGALVPLAGLVAVAVLLTQAAPAELAWGLAALAIGSGLYLATPRENGDSRLNSARDP
jgi:hypothetical protein